MENICVGLSVEMVRLENLSRLRRMTLAQNGLKLITTNWSVDSDFELFYSNVTLNFNTGTMWNIRKYTKSFFNHLELLSNIYNVSINEVARRAMAAYLYYLGHTYVMNAKNAKNLTYCDNNNIKKVSVKFNDIVLERASELSHRLGIHDIARHGLDFMARMGVPESANLVAAAARGDLKVTFCFNRENRKKIDVLLDSSNIPKNKTYHATAAAILRIAVVSYLDYVQKRLTEFEFRDPSIPVHNKLLSEILLKTF
ncbi:hypothetical protein [Geomobilimonas luticola]|uniref:Uncharacterized protein n=1 Tax=Geomobilimonas luticola TaxID=1114878 RepID=A0ABS5SAL3_9BACT|nr:hypothetical protein [Geomobilimonas luticola]MBT0651554.1 hypothetical protein [Geomobilimonas luticola]